MLTLFNTKLLIAILAALAVIGSAVAYQRHEMANAAAAAATAAKAAAILQQQQTEAEKQKARDDAFRRQVQEDRTRHDSAAAQEGNTWKTYLP